MGKGGFVLLLFLLLFWRRILFPTMRGWGAPLPYTPSGDGVREGCDPLALSRGLFGRRFWFPTKQVGGAYLPRLLDCCFGFRKMPTAFLLGTEAGEPHIFTVRFRRGFFFQRNACTALFGWRGVGEACALSLRRTGNL